MHYFPHSFVDTFSSVKFSHKHIYTHKSVLELALIRLKDSVFNDV